MGPNFNNISILSAVNFKKSRPEKKEQVVCLFEYNCCKSWICSPNWHYEGVFNFGNKMHAIEFQMKPITITLQWAWYIGKLRVNKYSRTCWFMFSCRVISCLSNLWAQDFRTCSYSAFYKRNTKLLLWEKNMTLLLGI